MLTITQRRTPVNDTPARPDTALLRQSHEQLGEDQMKSGVSARVPRERAAECVSGVLISEGAVLVEKRRADDEADPGLVLLPGGHVELGESLDWALKREMREELGIRVEKMTLIRVRHYTASNGERQRIHYFRIKDWKGKIGSNEAETVYWESDVSHLSDNIERKIVLKLLSQVSRV